MPDIFQHELSSYEREINETRKQVADLKDYMKRPDFNLTHFSLAVSNRSNLVVVGLTSLVEVRLLKLAEERERESIFELNDLRGNGLQRLKVFLLKTGALDLEKLASWPVFQNVATIRNVIVHGYGGMITPANAEKLHAAIDQLGITRVLFGNRIRFDADALMVIHRSASTIISEIDDSTAHH